jgi:Flp pilus assembly CpaE family ATPase
VRRVLDLLTRTHELICVDTGNNVESGNWRTIMEAADQLVITSVPREDSAFSADWMMDVLVELGREDLVASAVTLVSMTTPNPGPMQTDLVRHFKTRNRAVCVVPYDPAARAGRLDRPHGAGAGHPGGVAGGGRRDHGALRQ